MRGFQKDMVVKLINLGQNIWNMSLLEKGDDAANVFYFGYN